MQRVSGAPQSPRDTNLSPLLLARRQRLLDRARPLAADHLAGAGLVRRAGDEAVGALAALAVGAAAVAVRPRRERAADTGADLLQVVGAGLRQPQVARLRGAQDEGAATTSSAVNVRMVENPRKRVSPGGIIGACGRGDSGSVWLRSPDAVQRVSGAPQIRGPGFCCKYRGPGSAAQRHRHVHPRLRRTGAALRPGHEALNSPSPAPSRSGRWRRAPRRGRNA